MGGFGQSFWKDLERSESMNVCAWQTEKPVEISRQARVEEMEKTIWQGRG